MEEIRLKSGYVIKPVSGEGLEVVLVVYYPPPWKSKVEVVPLTPIEASLLLSSDLLAEVWGDGDVEDRHAVKTRSQSVREWIGRACIRWNHWRCRRGWPQRFIACVWCGYLCGRSYRECADLSDIEFADLAE